MAVLDQQTPSKLARHRVRDGLQEKILRGEYPAGTRLTQPRLAKEFGVSQSVVRESLLELKAFGLVDVRDQLGAFVSNLDPNKLLQAFEIREMLESLAARLCCERTSRAELRELSELAEQMYALATSGRDDEMAALDREFHRCLVRFSRNDMLVQLTNSYRVLGKFVRTPRSYEEIRDEHLGIIKAIEQNLPDEAERLMREHIRVAKRNLEQQIAEGGFTPRWVV